MKGSKYRIAATTQQDMSVKAHNDRRVMRTSVDCPTCGKTAGQQCVTANGGRGLHVARYRMALRAEDAA